MKTNRDLIGRIFGVFLFSAFLAFHIWSLSQEWQSLTFIAMANSLLVTLTILLFLAAYIIRSKAVSESRGFSEKIYPLFCSSLPFVILHNYQILALVAKNSVYFGPLEAILGFKGVGGAWVILATALLLVGNAVTLTGIFYLRRSFSIMVEARSPVYGGIYKYLRHPLYFGEIVATLGILVFRFSMFNVVIALVFIVAQVMRSRLEEKKLIAAFPEYEAYRQKTAAFFPKLTLKN